MPNKLKARTLRASYVESIAINKAISILAVVKGVTISSPIRATAEQDLMRERPQGPYSQGRQVACRSAA